MKTEVIMKDTAGRWFPDLNKLRIAANWTKLTPGDTYHEELERYKNHFEPLLKAEFAEEERMFNQRLSDWSIDKLKREGFMLDNLIGEISNYQPKYKQGFFVELKRGGKDAILSMPFHKFVNGTHVILSRSDPLVNPVLADGRTKAEGGTGDVLRAQVYNVTRGYIKVQFNVPIPDIKSGTWRLDIGLSDWSLQQQIKAIQSLNLDPAIQDIADMHLFNEGKDAPPTLRTILSDSSAKSDELCAVQEVFAQSKATAQPAEQTILQGSMLRDRILRAFQEDFVPYASTASVSSPSVGPKDNAKVPDGIVQAQTELKVTDVDAVNVPSHIAARPSGVLDRNQLIQSWTRRYRAEGDVVKSDGDPIVPLNASQMRAIAMMFSERLSLVQGPPGTGKTRVIIEAIKLLKKHWEIPHPILVTAHTNVAVDNLLSGLRDHGVKALRLGPVERVRADLQEHTFEEVVQSHPLFRSIERLDAEKEDLWRRNADDKIKMSKMSRMSSASKKEKIRDIIAQLHAKRAAMFADVLHRADVICTTCLSAASSYVLRHIDFPIVFLDEASMATEPLSLIPLMKGSSHVAVIGDHKQLPPVIISDEAKAGGLATSLFERLIHEHHIPSIMLDTQYRMHPAISSFPSKTFYNDALKDGTISSSGQLVPGFETPFSRYLQDDQGQDRNVMFIDHDYPESPETKSIANYGDAEIVADIVVDILHNNPDLCGSDIGIIAPYVAQIRLLDIYLNGDPTRSDAMADVLGAVRAQEVSQIEIRTVDGFEGREKKVIIFSTVRCNDAGHVGFLADWRRLNVGITRAKRGLIIVGSARTLEKAQVGLQAEDSLPQGGTDVWRDYMKHLRAQGAVVRG